MEDNWTKATAYTCLPEVLRFVVHLGVALTCSFYILLSFVLFTADLLASFPAPLPKPIPISHS